MNLSVWTAHAAECYGLEPTEPARQLRGTGDPVVRVAAVQGDFVLKGVEASGREGFLHLNEEELERQGNWAAAMAREGLPVMERIRGRDGRYFAFLRDGRRRWLTTAERFAPGTEFVCRDARDIARIGELAGRLHTASLRSGIRFGHGTSWSLFGSRATQELGDYDENADSFDAAERALAQGGCPEALRVLVRTSYETLRAEAEEAWPTLPQAAVQGDLCPYNLTRGANGEIAGVFDLNIAGDEVLVGELAALMAYYAAYRPDGIVADGAMIAFYRAYSAVRPLNPEERQVLETLLRIVAPFRFDRVARGRSGIQANGTEAAVRFAEETIELLERNYGFLFEEPTAAQERPLFER
ncbi:phosphotransferase enzyme family protein [Saccharibacillus sp. O23]|uniref:phosphotransferase enzyme family protein n=1 Tax=Saccharibacillus sp. O23 TaxID=2009338 RepID=UPI0015C682FD|nr:phosphotransferase [Saccharibacillus sp. O23]